MTDIITITGNLAAEPEQRTTANGAVITHFRVGSTHRRYDKATEQWVDSFTNWYQVSAFRALGENAFASLHKGDRVIVTGRLRLREWDNGTKRGIAVELDADAVGHDLLWGTTRFLKTGSQRMHVPESPDERQVSDEPAHPVPAAAAANGWAIPVAEGIPSAQPELVDTPF